MMAILDTTSTRSPPARDPSQTIFRDNHNNTSLTKDQPQSQPSQSSTNSKPFDFRQTFVKGTEADTETTSLSRLRNRQNTKTTRSPHLIVKQTTSPIKSIARQALPQLGSAEILHSPAFDISPVDLSPSYFTSKPSNNHDLRSPPIKRPPASRSSHGVETSAGPPPAISTRRTFSFELQQAPSSSKANNSPEPTPKVLAEPEAPGTDSQVSRQALNFDYIQTSRGRSTKPRSIASQSDNITVSTSYPASDFKMDRRHKRFSTEGSRIAKHRLSAQLNDTNLALQDAVSNGSSHEDLFLNMAQGARGDYGDQEQKSRNAVPSHRSSLSKAQPTDRPTTTHERRSSLMRPEITNDFRTPPAERVTTRDRAYASTAHPLEGRGTSRFSPLSPSARRNEAFEHSPSVRKTGNVSAYHSRFRSAQLPNSTDTFHQSPLNTRHQSLDQTPSPPLARTIEGTESTISTTAPSTVWDELDDLRVRIRKLEVTGKLPPSSSGSMERPQTAATSATTMSSSPKRNGTKSTSPTTGAFDEGSPHPLLSSALAKTKGAISSEAYRALEATSTDALNLAKMTLTGNNPSPLERQLKRKADNMCRSLVELCIALSAINTTQPERPPTRTRSVSRNSVALRGFPSPPQQQPTAEFVAQRRLDRAQSLEPEPTNGQRVLSRLEARRTSMKIDSMNLASAQGSPQTELHLELKTPTQSTIPRTNTVLHRRRLAEGYDGEDQDNTVRPLSRATTDLARANTTSAVDRERKRMSREYTSKYPLPSPLTRNLPGSSNVAGSRRSYLNSGVVSNNSSDSTVAAQAIGEKDLPITPSTPGFGSRRYLVRNTNIGEVDERAPSRTAVEPRQRHGSAGQYTTPRSLLSTRVGDRRSFIEANSSDEQPYGERF